MVLTEEEKKARRKIAQDKYLKTEKGKESRKKYRKSKKGKVSQVKYYKSEKGKEKHREYRKTEKYRQLQKSFKESEKGKKMITFYNWKNSNLIGNYEEIYERYQMAIFCDICECVLEGNGRNMKCMDHDHDNGEFRNIVCSYCNIHICK